RPLGCAPRRPPSLAAIASPVGGRDFVRAPAPEPPSIRVEPARPQAPSTVYAHGVRHAQAREPTHRTNGAFAGHPAAQRQLSPTFPLRTRGKRQRTPSVSFADRSGSLPSLSH